MPLLVDSLVPFGADGLVDAVALRAHLRWLFESGADGVIPAAAEMVHLDRRERERILEVVAEVAGGRTVIFPIWDPSPAQSLRLGRLCGERGLGALLPPPILESIREDAVVDWYRAIGEHVPKLHAWHDPRFDNPLTPRLLRRIVAETTVVGWLDASRDVHRLRRLATTWPGRTWAVLGAGLSVRDLRELARHPGLAGGVSRVGNAWPELARRAWIGAEEPACEQLVRRAQAVERAGGIAALKHVLRVGARLPLAGADPVEADRLPATTFR